MKFIDLYKKTRDLPNPKSRYYYYDRSPNVIHVSEMMKDRRDLFWSLTGVAETNPLDEISKSNFEIGRWIEAGIREEIISKMHFHGMHLIAHDVTVGGAYGMPYIGHIDALMYDMAAQELVVLEVKTKHGYGADLLINSERTPSDEYIVQCAMYVKTLQDRGKKVRGQFFYYLLSDRSWGSKVGFKVKVDANDVATVYDYEDSFGNEQKTVATFDLKFVRKRLEEFKGYLTEGKCPPPDYPYNTPLTPEALAKESETQLKKALKGERTLGPWQPRYSRYKDLIISTDKVTLEYSPEQLDLIQDELDRRKRLKKVG